MGDEVMSSGSASIHTAEEPHDMIVSVPFCHSLCVIAHYIFTRASSLSVAVMMENVL